VHPFSRLLGFSLALSLGGALRADADGQVLSFSMITPRSQVLSFSMIVHTLSKVTKID